MNNYEASILGEMFISHDLMYALDTMIEFLINKNILGLR